MDKKTWMPTTAGILDIISGSFGLIGFCALVIAGGVVKFAPNIPRFLPPMFMGVALPLAIVGILAIVGGIYAMQRRNWGLALAGSIAAFFPSWLLGIAAIIFTALSREEFEK